MITNCKNYLFHLLMLSLLRSTQSQKEGGTKPVQKVQDNKELIEILVMCFFIACSLIFLFFCLKLYTDFRDRNKPPPGPFDNLRDLKEISISELTPLQRRLILEVILKDNDCVKPHKKRDEVSEQSDKHSMGNLVDEECPPIKKEEKSSSNNSDEELPSLPTLQSPEIRRPGKHFLSMNPLKLPPSLKRQPMFSLIPNTHEEEGEGEDLYDKVEQGIQHGNEAEQESPEMEKETTMTPNTPTTPKTPIASPKKSCETEIKDMHCPICLDNYDDGDLIFHSRYCSHYFHQECIQEWLEKSFDCPCCRIEMITTDELAEAISKIMNKDGREAKKDIRIKPNIVEITPPPSPASSYDGSTPRSP